MKIFKKISAALFLILFLLVTSNSFSQKREDENLKQNKVSLLLSNTKFTTSHNLETINKSQLIKSESFYLKKIDANIIITFDDTTKKLLSIYDSSNTLSEELIINVINRVNENKTTTDTEDSSNKNTNYISTINTAVLGCAWWDLICQVKEAICKGMGQDPGCFDQE